MSPIKKAFCGGYRQNITAICEFVDFLRSYYPETLAQAIEFHKPKSEMCGRCGSSISSFLKLPFDGSESINVPYLF